MEEYKNIMKLVDSKLAEQENIIEYYRKEKEKWEERENELNLKIHQVGKAFTKAFLEHNEINLYHTDYRHPSYAGSYLSALVHAGSLTGHDVRLTNFNGDGSISEKEANTLKEVAYSILNNK